MQVHLAQRGLGSPVVNPNAQRYEPTYENFRFVMDGFNLDDYDEVWLFGFWGEEHPGTLTAAEVAALSTWMDKGGGVFATGAHGTLGAALCKDVPRVRSMRRWIAAQHPPPQHGPERHVTTQPATAGQGAGYEIIPSANEADNIPKPIHPVTDFLRNDVDVQGRLVRIESVHPLLCGIGSPIQVLPDHPNEGEVVDFVNINAFDEAEYPRINTTRPRPRVVAFARSGRPAHSGALLRYEGGPVNARDFATISAYDGQQVDVGRVVVDSSLHHWLDQNLQGLATEDLVQIQTYHLNVAVWLARPEQRLRAAIGSILTATLVYPGVVEIHKRTDDLRVVGGATFENLHRFLSPCEVMTTVMNPHWGEEPPELEDQEIEPLPEGCLSCPPWKEVMAYTLGGIVESLREVIAGYERRRTLKTLDAETILADVEAAVSTGAAGGRKQFAADLRTSIEKAKSYAEYVESLGGDRRKREHAREAKSRV